MAMNSVVKLAATAIKGSPTTSQVMRWRYQG